MDHAVFVRTDAAMAGAMYVQWPVATIPVPVQMGVTHVWTHGIGNCIAARILYTGPQGMSGIYFGHWSILVYEGSNFASSDRQAAVLKRQLEAAGFRASPHQLMVTRDVSGDKSVYVKHCALRLAAICEGTSAMSVACEVPGGRMWTRISGQWGTVEGRARSPVGPAAFVGQF